MRTKAKIISQSQRGDTIVEVVVSMAILAFALGGAYVLGNKALSTAIDASQRREATAIMQGQVELLKNAYKNNPSSFPSNYKVSTDYCLANVNGTITSSPANSSDTSSTLCGKKSSAANYDGTQYRTFIHWDSSNQAFVVKVYWDNINGRGVSITPAAQGAATSQGQSVITAYYRTPS